MTATAPAWRKTWRRGRQRVVGSPAYAALLAFLTAVIFFVGGIYGEDIKGAWPLYWGPYEDFSWTAATFWFAGLLTTVLLGARYKVEDDARRDLVNAANETRLFVQTLPPRSFRDDYAKATTVTVDLLRQLRPRINRDGLASAELAAVIRQILGAFATLAFRYDGEPTVEGRAALYACNVMLFEPRRSSSPYFDATAIQRLVFWDPSASLESLSGILVLKPELTFSTFSDGSDPDVPSIALAVPSQVTSTSGRFRVLPGAPLAFALQRPDGYADAESIKAWFDQVGDFPPSIGDAVYSYFAAGPGRLSRSFVSRPLTVGERRIGVMNLHSNRPNLLGPAAGLLASDSAATAERRQIFFSMLTPFWAELSDAVASYAEMDVHI